ncbi:hypothetical protein D3C72_1430780 [compost metagenome]
MCGHAFDPHVEPANGLTATDHTDALGVVLKDRALLDMRFEIGIHRTAQRAFTGKPGALQRLGDADTLGITHRQGIFKLHAAGEHRRAEHGRGKTCALFVGPHRHFQRLAGLDLQVVETTHHLKPGQHAVHTVKSATFGLSIEVAADHHRCGIGIATWATGKEVADRVDTQGHARLSAPMGEQLAPGLIVFTQGQAAAATAGGRTDFSHGHQARPQAFTVGFQHCRFSRTLH